MLFSMGIVLMIAAMIVTTLVIFKFHGYTDSATTNSGFFFSAIWGVTVVVLLFTTVGVSCSYYLVIIGEQVFGWTPLLWWIYLTALTQLIHGASFVLAKRN